MDHGRIVAPDACVAGCRRLRAFRRSIPPVRLVGDTSCWPCCSSWRGGDAQTIPSPGSRIATTPRAGVLQAGAATERQARPAGRARRFRPGARLSRANVTVALAGAASSTGRRGLGSRAFCPQGLAGAERVLVDPPASTRGCQGPRSTGSCPRPTGTMSPVSRSAVENSVLRLVRPTRGAPARDRSRTSTRLAWHSG
jgi:hypothetical protein